MPVPDNYVVEPNKQKKYYPMPADKYQVMIYDVNPIQELNFKGDAMVDKLDFTFVVLDDKKFGYKDEDNQPQQESTRGRKMWRKIPRSFVLGKKYKNSLFYELMCAIERRQLTEEGMVAVNPNDLIGQQLCVFVSVNEQWNNIDSFLPADKDLDPLDTVFDKDPAEQGSKENVSPKEAKEIFSKEEPSTENPKSQQGFVEGLEEEQKKEEASK